MNSHASALIAAISLAVCGHVTIRGLKASGRESVSVEGGTVTVRPSEYAGAINNPLKGFRDYKPAATD